MLKRFGVSLDKVLLEKFDNLIEKEGYTNRSEAIRDMIRERISQVKWKDDEADGIGSILVTYDHKSISAVKKLLDAQAISVRSACR